MELPTSPHFASSPVITRARVEVYDASAVRARLDALLNDDKIPLRQLPTRMNEAMITTPQRLARATGQSATGDTSIDRAFDNASTVDNFLRAKLGRNGWDGAGSPLRARVHMPSDNASWEYRDDSYWVGDRGQGASLGAALDVTAHEVAHGIYKDEVFDSPEQAASFQPDVWQAAVDESFADVFASAVDDRNWTMGEEVGDPSLVRDMARPRLAHMRDVPYERLIKLTGPSPTHIAGPTDVVGEHELSGIPSLAAVRAAGTLGRLGIARVWHRATVDGLQPADRFPEAAAATIAAARRLYGPASREATAVRDAWHSVGVV